MKIFPILVILIEKESLSLHQKSEIVLVTTIKQQIIMRNVLVSFEVSVSQESGVKFLCVGKPDFVFHGEFDKDDDKSFSALCDLEYKVEQLAKTFKDLGCQVIARKKEISSLDF